MKVNRETGEILDKEEHRALMNKVDALFNQPEKNDEQINPMAEVKVEATESTALIKIAPGKDQTIQRYADEVLKIQVYAEKLSVTDLDGDRRATEDVTIVKKLRMEIEAAQKEWLAPLREHEKAIKEAFALLLNPLAVADKTLRDKILAFRQEQERVRLEQERIAEEQRKLNEARLKLAEQMGEAVVEIEPVEKVTAPEAIKTLHTDLGDTTITKVWKWHYKEGLSKRQILEALPLEYHMVNETMIGQVVRAKNKNQVTEADFGNVIEIYAEQGLRVTER